MTIQEKAIEQLERISEHLSAIGEKADYTDIAIKALESQPTWIPVKDPLNELPKDRMLYVTTKFGDIETLVYDMTEWDDADVARCTVAYMDYYVPAPYKTESEDKE